MKIIEKLAKLKKHFSFTQIKFTFYNEDNQILFYIEMIGQCCSCNTRYIFKGIDKNIENVVSIKAGFSQFIVEEYDKYDIRTNWAENNSCKESFISEFDSNGNLKYKIHIRHFPEVSIKIYDSNDMEVNLSDRTLFNNGFSKIQIILILKILFFSVHDYD